MNIFIISPGRTATTTFSKILSHLKGFTSDHESNVKKLGTTRLDYPSNHIECDNRLIFFLAGLTEKYSRDGILVILKRDNELIARSYNKRWAKIGIMKTWSQGIHMRDITDNNLDVGRDFVDYCYKNLDFFKKFWKDVIEIDIENPNQGLKELLQRLNREEQLDKILDLLKSTKLNKNKSGIKVFFSNLKFNLRVFLWDMFH